MLSAPLFAVLLAAASLPAPPSSVAPSSAPAPAPSAQASRVRDASAQQEAPAASARDAELSWDEFHQLVIDRHAMGQVGREALQHLLRARVLDRLALESKLTISEREMAAKWEEIEGEIKRSGESGSLDEYLALKRVPKAKFREFLRLGLVQERLARQALGIPSGRAVNGEQQEMWLDQVMQQRGVNAPPPPWADGVVARCGDLELRLSEFLPHLIEQLTTDDIVEDCHRALLVKLQRARMPDLSNEAFELALDEELVRRRASALEDPKTKGLSFEQILASQGLTLEILRRDPAVRASALAYLWVARNYGEAGLRRTYDEDRELFDKRYGEAFETRILFLRGARFTNDLNPRSFEDAERELQKLATQIHSREDFERLAKLRSEDAASRERGGLLGYVSAGDETAPESLRAALFVGGTSAAERLVGPVRIANGVLLAWAGAKRSTPGWEQMREHVHNELRRRFIEETLPEAEVVTFLDQEAPGGRK